MLLKPARESNLSPLTSEDAKYVADKVLQAIILVPRHQHRGKSPTDCDTCTMLNLLVEAYKKFKRIGE